MPDGARIEHLERDLAEALEQQGAARAVLEIIGRPSAVLDPVFETVLEQAVRLCRADAGLIYMLDGDRYHVAFAIGGSQAYRDHVAGIPLERGPGTLVGRVGLGRETVQILDVLADPAYEMHRARELGGFRTMCGVPMLIGDKVVGVIVLWRETVDAFDARTVALVTTFAAQGAIAIQNAQLLHAIQAQAAELAEFNRGLEQRVAEQVGELERAQRLRRFLAPQVADLVVSSGDESFLESHRREITVLVCDLRGFSAFAEAVEPEEVTAVLRDYHRAVGEEIHRHEATLDRFSGGRVMAYLNDPLACADAPERAVRMAVAVRNRVWALAEGWGRSGYDLHLAIGIAQGHATLGPVGFEGRWEYGAIGSVTLLAERLSEAAEPGQVLVSRRVHSAAEAIAIAQPLGELALPGFARPTDAYDVIGLET